MINIQQVIITDLSTDVIINAASEHLQAGCGVAVRSTAQLMCI